MNVCAGCGTELRSQDADGLCTRCLLETGLQTESEEVRAEVYAPSATPNSSNAPGSPPVARFAEYELLEEIARGGMGVIYRARQPKLDRIVAVKMILAGPFASKEVIQRFRGEVMAAALLQHPNIVSIYDVGIHDGQHYFSMEYVPGQNLSQLVGNRPLPPAQAARYIKLIAEAVHHAHQQGVLHRDLKPSNILVDENDQPHITDFGLAKRFDGSASITLTGQMLGSPNFMPPEQADPQRGKASRSSDVYGLGAILYYLLTARPPFQGESFENLLGQVLTVEPVSPRLLNSSVSDDLETICLKCLQKEPAQRYQNARDLAEELERFLRREPIHARPSTQLERSWRWARRNPALASLAVALVAVFALGFAATFWQWRHAVRNEQAALREREHAEQNAYDSDMFSAQAKWSDHDLGGTLSLLKQHRPVGQKPDRRGFEWYYLFNLCRGDPHISLPGHSNSVDCVAFSPDGKHVATGSLGGPVRLWEAASGRFFKDLPAENFVSLAFNRTGENLAIGGHNEMAVWNLETGAPIFTQEGANVRFRLAFTGNGTLLVIGKYERLRRFGQDGGTTELWDYAAKMRVHVFPDSGGYIALSMPAQRLATANWAQTTKIWDLLTLQLIETLPTDGVVAMALSPDGLTLATSDGGMIHLWDVPKKTMRPLGSEGQNVSCLAFSRDGRFLAAGDTGQLIRVWDLADDHQIEQLLGHKSGVTSIDFSPDGRTLTSGGKDGTALLWNVHPNRIPTAVANVLSRPVFSPDSHWIAAGIPGGVALWDAATLRLESVFPDARDAVGFGNNGTALVTRSTNEFLKIFDLKTRTVRETITNGPVARIKDSGVLSPDGQTLVVGLTDGTINFFEQKTGKLLQRYSQLFSGQVFQLLFSSNGKLLAASGREMEAGRAPAVKIFNATTFGLITPLIGHADTVLGVAFTPETTLLATCGADNLIRSWDTSTWKQSSPFVGHKDAVITIAISPNGRTLASSSWDGTLKFWDVATRRELASLKPGFDISYLVFSPDGQSLASFGGGELHLWRAPTTDANL